MTSDINLAMNAFACGMLSVSFFLSPRWWKWLVVVPVFLINTLFVLQHFWGATA